MVWCRAGNCVRRSVQVDMKKEAMGFYTKIAKVAKEYAFSSLRSFANFVLNKIVNDCVVIVLVSADFSSTSGRRWQRIVLDRVERGVPGERGAFDAGRVGVHAGERGELAELIWRLAGGDDAVKIVEESLCLGRGFALESRGHDRGAGLRDGAALAVEGDVGDAVAVEPQEDAALVAARRVVAVGDAVGGGQLAAVARAAVVVEDDLLV